MNKLGDTSGAFDPLDYGGMVRMVFAFLERLARLREMHGADWPPSIVRPADRTVLLKLATETPAIIEAACLVAARTEGPFSLDFTKRILFDLERLNAELADVAKLESILDRETANLGLSTANRYSGLGPCFADVYAVWTALTDTYSAEFRGPLKLLELRAKHVPQTPAAPPPTEVAPRPSDQAHDVKAALDKLSRPALKAGKEWRDTLLHLERKSKELEEVFDPDDVSDEELWTGFLELSDEKAPNVSKETWLKYVGVFRKAIGKAKKPRRT